MAEIIILPSYSDENGILTLVEKIFKNDIKRTFFIYGVGNGTRGGHRHINTKNALVCLYGNCKVEVISENKKEIYQLDSPNKCLILAPEDYRKMYEFSEGAILVVLSDSYYDQNDYIY